MRQCKTTNQLMSHLRSNHNIAISGSKNKRDLINNGYFHGYKGYRFSNGRRLPYTSFNEIVDTIAFDSKLKSLFYEKVMFIESALKSIVTQSILDNIHSCEINDLFQNGIEDFHNNSNITQYNTPSNIQTKSLVVRNKVTGSILKEYKNGNKIITHYFENSTTTNTVPIWALIEILMLGDFGSLIASLRFPIRDSISKELEIPINLDTSRTCFSKMIYIFKDLRNAVAHNAVLYDCRFLKSSINNNVRALMMNEFHLPYANFKDIIDFVALIVYFNKHLRVSKTEQKMFITKVEDLISKYINKVGLSIAGPSFPNGWRQRLNCIKNNL